MDIDASYTNTVTINYRHFCWSTIKKKLNIFSELVVIVCSVFTGQSEQ